MKTVITLALLLIVGQAVAGEQVISVQHDSVRGVTCWILNDKAISCLPDSLLQQATPASAEERASPANFAHRNGLLQAAPLPQDERFQL